MSWEIDYTYEGVLCGVSIERLNEEKENATYRIERAWRQLLALAAATPPEQATSEVDTKYPYSEFLSDKLPQIREELEDSYWQLHTIREIEEVLKEHPERVTEG